MRARTSCCAALSVPSVGAFRTTNWVPSAFLIYGNSNSLPDAHAGWVKFQVAGKHSGWWNRNGRIWGFYQTLFSYFCLSLNLFPSDPSPCVLFLTSFSFCHWSYILLQHSLIFVPKLLATRQFLPMTHSTTSCSPLRIHLMMTFLTLAIIPRCSWATRTIAPQKPRPTLTECAQEVMHTAHSSPKLPFTSSWDLSSRDPSSTVIQQRIRCGGKSHSCGTCFAHLLKSLIRNFPFSTLTLLVLIPLGRSGSAPYGPPLCSRPPSWCPPCRFAVTVRSRCTRIGYFSILWQHNWWMCVADPLLDPCRVRQSRQVNQRPETTWCCEKAVFKASISPTDMYDMLEYISDAFHLSRLWSHQMKAMYVFLHLKSQHLSLSVSKVLSTKLNPRLNLWRDLLLIHWTERCVRHYWDLAPISHYSSKIRHRKKLFSVLGGDIDISCRYDAASGAQEGGRWNVAGSRIVGEKRLDLPRSIGVRTSPLNQ